MEKRGILAGFPPRSPDLNPIEMVFAFWANKVSERREINIQSLILAIREKWSRIPQSVVRECIREVKSRIRYVVDTNSEFFHG